MNKNSFATKEEYNAYMRGYRAARRPVIREYNRNYNSAWRKFFGYHSESKSKAKYPWKEIARKRLREAVRQGVVKKRPCRKCKNPKSEAHHPDYSKPLTVIWLCRLCHTDVHKKLRSGETTEN